MCWCCWCCCYYCYRSRSILTEAETDSKYLAFRIWHCLFLIDFLFIYRNVNQIMVQRVQNFRFLINLCTFCSGHRKYVVTKVEHSYTRESMTSPNVLKIVKIQLLKYTSRIVSFMLVGKLLKFFTKNKLVAARHFWILMDDSILCADHLCSHTRKRYSTNEQI